MERRDLFGLMGGALTLASFVPTVASGAADLLAEADAALNGWADALYSGDNGQVAAVLAPQFQIVRATGEGFSKDDYLKHLPVQKSRLSFSDVVATGDMSLLVLRYTATADQVIDGVTVSGAAPRLSVFIRDQDRWLLLAHANFAVAA